MRLKLSIVLCSVGLALFPAAPTDAVQAGSQDWVLAVASIGSSGAFGLSFRLHGQGHMVADEPVAAGEGFSWPGHYTRVAVLGMGANGIQLRSGADAGAVDVSIATPLDGQFNEFTFDYSFTIDNLPVAGGDKVAILAFFPGGSIDVHSTELDVVSGSGTVAVRSGSGSVAVRVADPAQPGIAVGFGPAGAALNLARTGSLTKGLVGAFNIDECEGYCQGSWKGPGTEGSFTQVHPHMVYGAGTLLGNHWFAGPKGVWELDWSGSAFADERPIGSLLANPVVLGWAPIGRDHRLFPVLPPTEIPLP
jgi:hypothetical protein